MHLKKFALLYMIIVCGGLFLLSFKDLMFIAGAETQQARVDHHVPAETKVYYKLGGQYEEKSLSPAIEYQVNGQTLTFIPKYSCKDGCHKIDSPIFIFYKKEKPHEVLVSSFGDMWKYKIYFLITMGVLLVTAMPYLYYHINRKT